MPTMGLLQWIEKVFEIGRPNICWLILRNIKTQEEIEPLILLTLSKYFEKWLIFNRFILNMTPAGINESFDITPFMTIATHTFIWNNISNFIPWLNEIVFQGKCVYRKKEIVK